MVVLTGAGISAESGIPTFRDPLDGFWSQFDPEELASRQGFKKDPKLVMEWYAWRREMVLKAKPNAAHEILAKWENRFKNLTLITQNVDGLHQSAGSKKVLEMHGNIHRLKCFDKSHPCDWPSVAESPLTCSMCGSQLRPDIVWFGEYLSSDVVSKIDVALMSCDVFFAIGTSGVVYPAAGYLDKAKSMGALTVVINPDRGSKGNAECFIQETASKALSIVDSLIQ